MQEGEKRGDEKKKQRVKKHNYARFALDGVALKKREESVEKLQLFKLCGYFL